MAKDYLLFNRFVSIRAGTLLLDGLDATFTIEKNTEAEPNKCELRVYNLTESNRRALQALKNVEIEILAGYKGLENAPIPLKTAEISTKDDQFRIFKGDVVQIFSQREGPDWVTTLRTADGMTSRQESRLNQTWKKGFPYKQMIQDLLRHVKVDTVGIIKRFAGGDFDSEGADGSILNSYTVIGSAHAEIEKHFKKLNIKGFIEDNQLIALKKGQTLGTEAVRLTPETGLLDSPELTNDGLLKCRSLIRPEIRLGHQLKIESASFTGTYRIEKLNYSASTFAEEWFIDIEASPL
jgi:hypothetical protein